MFGKLMSISDELMWRYYLLLTDLSARDVDDLRAARDAGALHPKQAKVDLAKRMVGDFHSAAEPTGPPSNSRRGFPRRIVSGDVPTLEIELTETTAGLPKLMVAAGLATSASDATGRSSRAR